LSALRGRRSSGAARPSLLLAGKAIVLWRTLGTHSGPIEPPGIPPTNRSFVIDGADHWTFRDGLVSRCRAYWDLNDLLRQLGLAPTPQ